MTAIQLVDNFGAWDDLGVVQPIFEQWVEFPRFTRSLSPLTRLNFGGDLAGINSYAYIRCVYVQQNIQLLAPWIRIYPKIEPEYILYPHPQDFGQLKVIPQRFFQVQKRHYRRRFVGTHPDALWTLNLQVCNERIDPEEFSPEQDLIVTGFF